ncbi:major facilitator superfamily protein [Actinidia rufa]|uniref:Major facilitator superfamily protein n=1 Tax=Actinidia rufa TaxID=165716 RepID=A0A7J0EVK3_9ERIC|nr:major facilitator superfamily protein [Actinidia rufa]
MLWCFLLCLLAGCSICWFNTVCYVLCIKNFPANRPLALALSISFNGVSAALYTLIANAINSGDDNDTLYLLLNALIPLLASVAALLPIHHQPPSQQPLPADAMTSSFYKELVRSENSSGARTLNGNTHSSRDREGCCANLVGKDQLMVLGEEHPAKSLVRRRDFWLYYVAYFCSGTIGLVYSNNIGQISQSLGYSSRTSSIVTLYSASSFFGRLLSAAPDFLRDKACFARTGWFAVAIVPTPIAFLLLALSGGEAALTAATAMIGLSSGFVFAAAVSITSELFGPNSAGVNHNIIITNIPLGSVLYGLVAALVYDANIESSNGAVLRGDSMVCMGRKCYFDTFVLWGFMSLLGLASSFLLFLRTRHAYDHLERTRRRMQFS